MADRFREINRDTPHLFPPTVQDYLPEDHLARFVVDIVDQLDLSPLTRSYGGRGGSAAWHPAMRVSLLFYGYATGTFSSRKLEAATHDSVAVRFICANQHPDHDSISAFRQRFLSELEALFVQILVIAHEMGTVSLGHQDQGQRQQAQSAELALCQRAGSPTAYRSRSADAVGRGR